MTIPRVYPIVSKLAVLGSHRRPGRPISPKVRFVVAHDTGNPGASADAHARWYRSDPNPPRDKISSAHLFVDDTAIVETIPAFAAAEQALHVLYDRPRDNVLYGVDANRGAIGVEYCYGGNINANEAYARYVWVIARLCNDHGLDPSRDVVGHHILDPGRKSDPEMGLRASGRSYATLLKDVVSAYSAANYQETAIDHRIRPGGATVLVNLRRRQTPGTEVDEIETLLPGTAIEIQAIVDGSTVSGNPDWCQLVGGGFCWSGGVEQANLA